MSNKSEAHVYALMFNGNFVGVRTIMVKGSLVQGYDMDYDATEQVFGGLGIPLERITLQNTMEVFDRNGLLVTTDELNGKYKVDDISDNTEEKQLYIKALGKYLKKKMGRGKRF